MGIGLTTQSHKKKKNVRQPTNQPRIRNENSKQRKRQRIRTNDIKLATWNVRTMLQPGKMMEVANETLKYNIDVVALQEIRFKDCGKIDKKDFSLYYSGSNDRAGQLCTGFIIKKKVKNCILGFEPISDRICKIRIKGKFQNITIISAHAPTEEKDDNEKDLFFDQLEKLCEEVQRYDMLVVCGDFNAKIGKESFVSEVAGKFTIHDTTSNNGKRLCNFATAYDLIIKSTCFEHKKIHLGTWISPSGNTLNQIDHILISRKYASSIIDVRAYRGPNCDSDHFLVKSVIRQRISNVSIERGERKIKWNVEKLKSEENKSQYVEKLTNLLGADVRSNDVDENWKQIARNIKKSAEEVIGVFRRQRNTEWFDNDCEEAIKRKNEARNVMLQKKTRLSRRRYDELRKIAKKMCKKKKKDAMNKKVQEIEEHHSKYESKNFFGKMKIMRNGFQPKLNACKNKQGKVLSEEAEILERWAEYYNELLNSDQQEIEPIVETYATAQPFVETPSLQEVTEAINKMKNGKAAGEDSLVIELIKHGGIELQKRIHELVYMVWEQEKIPEEWNIGIVKPIFKKGDKLSCENYRGITLLNVVYKIFSSILHARINVYADGILGEYQAGFRANRSTTDQIFALRQAMEKCYEYNIDLYIIFIDFMQAFDKLNRNEIFKALEKLGIPHKLINLVKATLENNKAKVSIGSKTTRQFEVTAGVRQGDSLSALLFNLTLETVLDGVVEKGSIMIKSTQMNAYADDIALVARRQDDLKEKFIKLERNADKVGLKINEHKTKFMTMSRSQVRREQQNYSIGDYNIEGVKDFKYLGTHLCCNNSVSACIQDRIQAGSRCYYANIKMLRSKILSRKSKLLIYKSLIRPVVTYGAECWSMTSNDEKSLRIFERRILRKIFGPIRLDENNWRIRSNNEINDLIENEDLVRFIKAQRIKWAGHVQRMEETRMPKILLNGKPGGRREAGRPRRRWLDDLEDDLRMMQVRNWKNAVSDRENWRRIVKEAKVHTGL